MQKHIFLQRLVLAKGAVKQVFENHQLESVVQDVLDDCLSTVENGCTKERIDLCCNQINSLRDFILQDVNTPSDSISLQDRARAAELSLLLHNCVLAEMKPN